MMRLLVKCGVALALVGTLVACQVAVAPPIDGEVLHVTASSSSDQPVRTVSLPAAGEVWLRVAVPAHLRGSGQRLVVEADDDDGFRQLDLVLYEPDGFTPTASTSGTAYFRPGLQGIGFGDIGTSLGVEADRSVAVVGQCFGPCISRRAPNTLTHVYVRVMNASNTAYTVPFYAYAEAFIDAGEPSNDDAAGAVPVSFASPYRGALERLGDVDWVRFTQSGTINLAERAGYNLNTRLTIFSVGPGGGLIEVGTIAPGQSASVFSNEYGRIRSSTTSPRASVYGFYNVFYGD
jgi:hypothetical protein